MDHFEFIRSIHQMVGELTPEQRDLAAEEVPNFDQVCVLLDFLINALNEE